MEEVIVAESIKTWIIAVTIGLSVSAGLLANVFLKLIVGRVFEPLGMEFEV